ncbi:WD40/YVTN/BNR-like repeat-containing protein [Sporosarcina ureae]|uniref:Glycosyl hydrolase n=1 Tax=Sporosarcina ureae TaxID=1571 RepID=A0ABM6JS71_SPOUR|nr:glycosyl hydrolase [Sporosarcina ureae]ARF12990.1 glycosyl hydrolase [Sporosarcina ureae]
MVYIFRGNPKKILLSLLTNPLFILVYWIFCYELALLCMYGRIDHTVSILFISTVSLISIIAFSAIKIVKGKELQPNKWIHLKAWKYVSIVIMIVITLFYGMKIYQSATNFGGELAWFIDRLKNEVSVEFEHNNIYVDGVEGIFTDINKEYALPKKLYMESDFHLEFNPDGTITSFDTFVYGKNADEKEESFLITYDQNKAFTITIRVNGYLHADYDEDKLVEPLIRTVKVIPVKQTVGMWNEGKYGVVYYGKRNWGYNTEGIIHIDENGMEQTPTKITSEIIGYTVSIFVPGKEKEVLPARYNLIGDPDWSQSNTTQNQESFEADRQEIANSNEQFYYSKEVGYMLNVTDKALGSTLYSLRKTSDGGETWTVINQNPFNGTVGSAAGITFINDEIGFLRAARPSGTEGVLYRTNDGGISFEEVSYAIQEMKVDSGQSINPFDFPGLPFVKDGVLNLLVGQGSDGDYNGNSSGLYQSNDKGVTWEYIKEVEN